MKLDLDYGAGSHYIHAYEIGQIRIHDRLICDNIVVFPESIICPWAVQSVATLSIQDFSETIALKPEIILLGTGKTQLFPPIALRAQLSQQGIGFEVMDSAAACRTYNILMSENRKVAAALFLRSFSQSGLKTE